MHADKRQMLQDLTQSLQNKPTKNHVLWELASCISSAVGADGFRLYLPDTQAELNLYLGEDENGEHHAHNVQKIRPGGSVPYYVAKTREPVKLSRGTVDSRFPDGIPNEVEFLLQVIDRFGCTGRFKQTLRDALTYFRLSWFLNIRDENNNFIILNFKRSLCNIMP